MGKLLEQLKRDGSILMWHDYRLGHGQDLSGNGNHVVAVNGDPEWSREGVRFSKANDSLLVDGTAQNSLGVQGGTLFFAYGNVWQANYPVTFPTLMSQREAAAGYNYQVRLSGATAVSAESDGFGSTTFAAAELFGRKSHAIVFEDTSGGGERPSFYYDGLFQTTGTNAIQLSGTVQDIYIGNWYGNGRQLFVPLATFLIIAGQLTATQIAQLHAEVAL